MLDSVYLRKQAAACLEWSRSCFDLAMAQRLRLMAKEFVAKADEIESTSSQSRTGSTPNAHGSSPPDHAGPITAGDDAS
jgi:hypothetical protein